MKKLILIVTLLVYGGSSLGMTLHVYYCCGKLESIRFSPAQHPDCCEGAEKSSAEDDCCEYKQVNLHIPEEEEAVQADYTFSNFESSCASLPITSFPIFPRFKESAVPIFSPPQNVSGLFRLYANYRI